MSQSTSSGVATTTIWLTAPFPPPDWSGSVALHVVQLIVATTDWLVVVFVTLIDATPPLTSPVKVTGDEATFCPLK
ncbi:hypothetical protein KA013_01050 [Patescibacteria group bacterium]|nr:hypothetical protein [Patescibacteria group bacterium]